MKQLYLSLFFLIVSPFYLLAQNVGIGTSIPNAKLEVAGDVELSINMLKFSRTDVGQIYMDNADDFHLRNSQQNNEIIIYDGSGGIGFNYNGVEAFEISSDVELRDQFNANNNDILGIRHIDITGQLRANGNAGTTGQILQTSGSGITWVDQSALDDEDWEVAGNHMYSSPSGNVGIGTGASPSAKLQVTGGNIRGDDGFEVEVGLTTGIYDDATSNAPYSRVSADGFHTNGLGEGQIFMEGRAIDANTYIMIGAGLAGAQSAQDVIIGNNNEIRVETASNYVGISNSNPNYTLDVSGEINLTSALRSSGDAGTNGQILQTTGTAVQWVDQGALDDEDWMVTGNDMYAYPSGNVGIGVTVPLVKVHVQGNILSARGDGTTEISYGNYVPVPSVKKASEVSFGGTSTAFPNLVGESDPCSGAVTFAAAQAHAEAQGGRLPTLEEIESGVASGTGCGYDSEYVWTQSKCGDNAYWVTPGLPSNLGSMPRECRVATATAYTRFVAETDKGYLPAIVDGNGAVRADEVRARVGNGLQLTDDAGNLGVFVEDGGYVGINNNNPTQELDVTGIANVSNRITVNTSTTDGRINAAGSNDLPGLWLTGEDNIWFDDGQVRITTHDGYGNWQIKTGADNDDVKIGSSDGAIKMRFDENGLFQLYTASGLTNGNTISWNTGIIQHGNGNVGVGTSSPSQKLQVAGRVKSNGINETSDARMKKDIQPLGNALSTVLAMRGVTYNWRVDEFPEYNFDERRQLGVIAQEIEAVVPEVVFTDEDGYKSVDYSHLVPLLIEAIKEQQGYITNLEDEFASLCEVKEENEALRKQVEENTAILEQIDWERLVQDYQKNHLEASK